MTKGKNGLMTEEQFVLKAIETLRKGGYRGIHSVYSGFNGAFRKYYGEGADPIGATTRLSKAGTIVIAYRRGGVMIYKPGEAPEAKDSGSEALAKMGV